MLAPKETDPRLHCLMGSNFRELGTRDQSGWAHDIHEVGSVIAAGYVAASWQLCVWLRRKARIDAARGGEMRQGSQRKSLSTAPVAPLQPL
jgi:hypothetical protein